MYTLVQVILKKKLCRPSFFTPLFLFLRGYYTPDFKIACFVCYRKVTNIFLKK